MSTDTGRSYKKGTSIRTSKKKVQIADETARALDLKREGKSLRDIAAELGCSAAKAHYLVENGIKGIPTESRDALVTSMCEQLAAIAATHFPLRRDPASAKILIDVQKQAAALLGLEAPKQSIVATTEVSATTPAEAQRIMRELFAGSIGPPITSLEEPKEPANGPH